MRLLPAAAVATVAALLELTVVRHLSVNGAHPHLVLVLGVIWTVAAGAESGVVWAFVGGLALDVLAPRPLGATAVALLLALGAVSVAAPAFRRSRPIAPILLAPVASVMSSLALLVLLGAAGTSAGPDAAQQLTAGVVYDAALAALLGPLAVVLHDRRSVIEPGVL
jgi:rod shape-determining protein MreD